MPTTLEVQATNGKTCQVYTGSESEFGAHARGERPENWHVRKPTRRTALFMSCTPRSLDTALPTTCPSSPLRISDAVSGRRRRRRLVCATFANAATTRRSTWGGGGSLAFMRRRDPPAPRSIAPRSLNLGTWLLHRGRPEPVVGSAAVPARAMRNLKPRAGGWVIRA